jgi:hypothetical protein
MTGRLEYEMGKKKAVVPPKTTRKERSRLAREAQINRWLVGGAIAIGVLVVGVLVYGFVVEEVIKGREPVAYVNGEPIETGDWQARVRESRERLIMQLDGMLQERMLLDPNDPNAEFYFEQLDQQVRELQNQLAEENAVELGRQVLEQMAQEEIFRQEAEARGISVGPSEVERSIEQIFGYDRTADESSLIPSDLLTSTETTTGTMQMTEEEFDARYQSYLTLVLNPSGLGEAGFREMVEASLLGQRVEEEIGSEVPTIADQALIRLMSFQTVEEAASAMTRLNADEEWESIVESLEASEESSIFANELEWLTEDILILQFGESIAERVFESEIGSYGGPLEGETGFFYIIEILGREERELDEFVLAYEQGLAFQAWLEEQMETVEFVDGWDEKVPFD